MKLELPPEPVDGYTFTVWVTDILGSYPVEHRFAYHVHTKQEDVHKHGLPTDMITYDLDDSWVSYQDGKFVGRNFGWENIKSSVFFASAYPTFAEAAAETKNRLHIIMGELLTRLEECHETLYKLDNL